LMCLKLKNKFCSIQFSKTIHLVLRLILYPMRTLLSIKFLCHSPRPGTVVPFSKRCGLFSARNKEYITTEFQSQPFFSLFLRPPLSALDRARGRFKHAEFGVPYAFLRNCRVLYPKREALSIVMDHLKRFFSERTRQGPPRGRARSHRYNGRYTQPSPLRALFQGLHDRGCRSSQRP